MLGDIAPAQAIYPALFLLVGGLGKAVDIRNGSPRDTVLARLLQDRISLAPVSALVAMVEFSVGALLLIPVLTPWSDVAAACVLAVAAATAALGVRRAPGADCGCMGAIAQAKVSRRTIVRALVLAAMAGLAALADQSWVVALGDPRIFPVLLAELAAVTWLSPEFSWVGRSAQRLAQSACIARYIPLHGILRHLYRSELWGRTVQYIRDVEPTDHWREACWQFLSFAAVYEGSAATAVFAVRLGMIAQPAAVALVDDQSQKLFNSLGRDQT